MCLSRGDCARVISVEAAGSYHNPNHGGDNFYEAGHGLFGEARNFFIFNVPNFPAPLVAVELRLYAGTVVSPDNAVLFELHAVKAHPLSVMNYSGFYASNFNALAAGAVLGSQAISVSQGRSHPAEPGAVITIPLNGDGLSELTVRQGDLIAFGGVVPNRSPNSQAFGLNTAASHPPKLVLRFPTPARLRLRSLSLPVRSKHSPGSA